jgi:uncharacterized protein (DUF1501 family)
MHSISRRELLTWFAIAPTLPHFLVRSAEAAAAQGITSYDGPIVVVLRMLGGNDGFNTVVPFRDDRYYRARPTIALPAKDVLALDGHEVGLHPSLTDFRRLMDDGHAGIVQGVGYPKSSRSHSRATEIWEAGSVADPAPAHGWLGRYLDHACECAPERIIGVQFAETLGKTLSTATKRTASIGHPALLMQMTPSAPMLDSGRGPRPPRMDYLSQVENSLVDASRQLHRAAKGTGRAYDYPNTAFGESLRWTADMIESGCPTRAYYVTIGSFDGPEAVSFDTHIEQTPKHQLLFSELGRGLRAFRDHLRRSKQLDRVLLLTFSDFGRQLPENRTAGTEHGDAGVLFYMGGAVRPGLVGQPGDLGTIKDGGVEATVDFRRIYTDVLANWLAVDAASILRERVQPFPIVNRRT